MSLFDDYSKMVNQLNAERDRRYTYEYNKWQYEQSQRDAITKTLISAGVGAVTGGIGMLAPAIAGGASGALYGGLLGLVPGGLTLPFLKTSIAGSGKADTSTSALFNPPSANSITTNNNLSILPPSEQPFSFFKNYDYNYNNDF